MFNINRFNALVKEKGVTKAFIASKLEKNQTIFHDWVKGKSKPSDISLQIIADLLDSNVAYLMGESDQKEKEAAPEGQPLSPEKRRLLKTAGELSEEELRKVIEYADFVKSQRKRSHEN